MPGLTSTDHSTAPAGVIQLAGARVHNLRNLSLEIPRQQLVAITGVSGSGKSSLAFHTLFAEGQRRYLECLSVSSRRLLSQLAAPDIDRLDGLPPTVCVNQHQGPLQPRSTLGTLTELHDYFRLLFARAGQPHCVQCGRAVSQQSSAQIVERILALQERQKVLILAPLVIGEPGSHGDVFRTINREGFVRARVDGELVDVTKPPLLEPSQPHDIEAVIDRIIVKEGIEARLQESVDLALKHGDQTCIISVEEGESWDDHLYSSRFACPACGLSFPNLQPRLFSYSSPYGACLTCEGLGTLTGEAGEILPCAECQGARLQPFPRAVTFAGQTLPALLALPVSLLQEFLVTQSQRKIPGLTEEGRAVTKRLLPEMLTRVRFLLEVGLDYLSLDRPGPTLSGGEYQRTRLAGCLGAGLRGVCYLLDEPTMGLHPRDTARLIAILRELRDQGNSVIVVEHDPELMRQADYLIDLGPGAGAAGGELCAAGPVAELLAHPERFPRSETLRYLQASGLRELSVASSAGLRPPLASAEKLKLTGATLHHLKNVTLELPLGRLIGVAGVSGSGKSSLIVQTLVPALRARLSGQEPAAKSWKKLTGGESLRRVIDVDQSPIGRSGRSNPATFTGLWDEIRQVLAQTREAKVRGFTAKRFSFNDKSGRCEFCLGEGVQAVKMDFLPDLETPCPVCEGKRFNPQTLGIRYRGHNAADLLRLRVGEAVEFFEHFPRILPTLRTLDRVGLGYLTLGQPATTLSGGEAQRLKLATELGQASPEPTLFVLDEPTTGLHPLDIRQLTAVLRELVAAGHTVLVIEHHLDLLRSTDRVIELGPEGGRAGGEILFTGTPAELATADTPTGRAMR